jgi:hypothetical protein
MKSCPEKIDSRGKYTETGLITRRVGKFCEQKTQQWTLKLETYRDEGLWGVYLSIMRSLRSIMTDVEGHFFKERAHNVAQIIIDKFLFQRCRGVDVPIPGPVVSESSLQKVNSSVRKKGVLKATAKKADFTKWDGKIDTISDLNWIYNHLMVADVTVDDAPSPGAWAHLQYHRSNEAAMAEFFTKVYPRLIPAKGTIQKMQDKFHDDGRTTFDLLDRLLAEDEAGEGKVPVLQVVLPERAGLQDQAGKPDLSQEGP